MSLRLLPAFTMDNDEDDDGNFTKWMSSYWGHGAEAGHSRERKRSFRRPARRTQADRRASLPCVSQLDAMKLNRLHAATMAPAPIHIKTREEKGEVRPHCRARRVASDDNGRSKTISESRISTIPELAEAFEKRFCFRDKKTASLAARRLDRGQPHSSSEAAAGEIRKEPDERRKSAEGPFWKEQEYHTPRRQLSLRRHR
ncbi:leukemia NUP98 fusion partner 1 [Diretmus argenteus]